MARRQAALARDLRDRTAGRIADRIRTQDAARVFVVGRTGVGRSHDKPEALVPGEVPEFLPGSSVPRGRELGLERIQPREAPPVGIPDPLHRSPGGEPAAAEVAEHAAALEVLDGDEGVVDREPVGPADEQQVEVRGADAAQGALAARTDLRGEAEVARDGGKVDAVRQHYLGPGDPAAVQPPADERLGERADPGLVRVVAAVGLELDEGAADLAEGVEHGVGVGCGGVPAQRRGVEAVLGDEEVGATKLTLFHGGGRVQAEEVVVGIDDFDVHAALAGGGGEQLRGEFEWGGRGHGQAAQASAVEGLRSCTP